MTDLEWEPDDEASLGDDDDDDELDLDDDAAEQLTSPETLGDDDED